MPVAKGAITAEEMSKIDQKAAEFGIPRSLLMENAGSAVARFVSEKFGSGLRTALFAGTGNNGGDGFVAARHLLARGGKIDILLIGNPSDIRTEEARMNWEIIRRMRRNINIHVIKDLEDLKGAVECLKRADVIIDAMLGTGLKGALREPFASAVRSINDSGLPVVAVDSPTGLNPSTGEVHGVSVRADYTLTFHKMKKGFPKAREHTGEIVVADIGIPPEVESAALGRPRSERSEHPVIVSACAH